MFLKISLISLGKTCVGFSLIKLQTWRPATLLKRDSNTGEICEICEILKNTYFEEYICEGLSVLSEIQLWRSQPIS